jgi:hypothetical protein
VLDQAAYLDRSDVTGWRIPLREMRADITSQP